MSSLIDIQNALGKWSSSALDQLQIASSLPPTISPDIFQIRDYAADLFSLAEQGLASNVCQQLIDQLNIFNDALDPAHEVGICVIGVAGQGITFRPTDLGAWDPSLVIIFGQSTTDSQPVQVVQHVSQLSVAFITVTRSDPALPKRPIGFHHLAQVQKENAEATPR